MIDRRKLAPLLTVAHTAIATGGRRTTVRRWTVENAGGAPLVHANAPRGYGEPVVPFLGVVEAHVLRAFRDFGIPLREIREAVGTLRQEAGGEYALASQDLAASGLDLMVRRGGAWERARDRQYLPDFAIPYLKAISYGSDGLADTLRLKGYDSAEVILDPRFNYGRPVFAGSKAAVEDVLDLFYAGEPVNVVAEEFRIEPADVEAALRAHQRVLPRTA